MAFLKRSMQEALALEFNARGMPFEKEKPLLIL